MSAYDEVKEHVDELERLFYETLAAADRYDALLVRLAERERAAREPNAELVRRFEHQQGEVREVRDAMEGAALEALLRIVDRILMIRHTEEGRFL